jgi:ribosomal protein S18 acetylase RimI-like enzyme
MTTLIRQAEASDIGPLIALARRTISASYGPFLGETAVGAFLGSGAADRYVEENLGRCSVLVHDGRVVGLAVCWEDLIDLMMIDNAEQHRGLGTILLQHVEAALFQQHATLRLESFEGNQIANAFYRKNGWVEVSKYLDQDSGVNKIVFGKAAGSQDKN